MPKLADDARFNRFHAKVLLWCLLILIIDGYDIAVMGIALPSIMQQMGRLVVDDLVTGSSLMDETIKCGLEAVASTNGVADDKANATRLTQVPGRTCAHAHLHACALAHMRTCALVQAWH